MSGIKRGDIEIMAPVGSFESLTVALQSGADSVYFGIEHLNMRSKSSANFTTEDLKKIVQRCREHGVKSYLTLNTIMYDEDLTLMKELIEVAKEVGLSAVIASDPAALSYANSVGVEVHLSTQLNISNVDSLRFYAKFADVVVLARELNMDQVKEIYKAIQEEQIKGPSGDLVRIEMFCHGALCMAVSGKCYMSLHEVGPSANRGSCTQQCRRKYIVKDKESDTTFEIDNEYIMSPKDLKTIHFLNKMIDAGVGVLKIEGRARGAEYVKTVVTCYDEALRSICDETYDDDKIAAWDERLKKVFNRGFWNGYYLGQRLGEWTHRYGSSATHKKIYIGKCTNFFSKLNVAEFKVEARELEEGEELIITGPTTGVIELSAEDIRVELKSAKLVSKGEFFSIQVPEKVRRNDQLYKLIPNIEGER